MSATPPTPPAIVVMGPSGCGKTTLGQALAACLGGAFVEGDTLHPPANIAKMARGEPLDDTDREPFLAAVAARLAAADGPIVITCSALRRRYRDRLRQSRPDALFVLPIIPRAVLEARLAGRSGHFMPASLLASQLDTLEEPAPDESAIRVDGQAPAEQ